jgi:predicted transglutaminase-like cysteine proteinase
LKISAYAVFSVFMLISCDAANLNPKLPQQYTEWCKQNPNSCSIFQDAKPIELSNTSSELSIVWDVYRSVKKTITHCVDEHEYKWEIPQRNCIGSEDYALLMRQKLYESGVPAGAMSLATFQSLDYFEPLYTVLLVHLYEGQLLLSVNQEPTKVHFNQDRSFWLSSGQH